MTIPALASGKHTLQLRVTTMGDLAAWYESHQPMPANCWADGPIIALICEYRSQDLTLTVTQAQAYALIKLTGSLIHFIG